MGALLHAVFFVPALPWMAAIRESWTGLLGDGVHLFMPGVRLSSLEMWMVCTGLLMIGRVLRVRESEEEVKPVRFPVAIDANPAKEENRSWPRQK
jgi:hypothetical protein